MLHLILAWSAIFILLMYLCWLPNKQPLSLTLSFNIIPFYSSRNYTFASFWGTKSNLYFKVIDKIEVALTFFFPFKTKSPLQADISNSVMFIFQLVVHMWEHGAGSPFASVICFLWIWTSKCRFQKKKGNIFTVTSTVIKFMDSKRVLSAVQFPLVALYIGKNISLSLATVHWTVFHCFKKLCKSMS